MTILVVLGAAIVGLIIVIILSQTIWLDPLKKAYDLEAEGKTAKALEEYLGIVSRTPSNYTAHYYLAKIYESKKNFKQAKHHYSQIYGRALSLKGVKVKDVDIAQKLAYLSRELNQIEDEYKYHLLVLDDKPSDFEANKRVGIILVSHEDYSFAISFLEKAKSSQNDDLETLSMLAYAYYNENYSHEAVANFSSAIRVKSSTPLLYGYLFALISAGDYKKAYEMCANLLTAKLSHKYLFALYRLYIYLTFKTAHLALIDAKINESRMFVKNSETPTDEAVIDADAGFYNYYMNDLKTALNYFNKVKNSILSFGNIDTIITYLTKLLKTIEIYKKSEESVTKETLVKEGISISDEEESSWEKSLNEWETSIIPRESVMEIATIPPYPKFDSRSMIKPKTLNHLLEEEKERAFVPVAERLSADVKHVKRLASFSFKDFSQVCSNVVKNRLGFSVLQEINCSKEDTFLDGDGVDFICDNPSLSDKSKVKVSFRRWKTEHVGELAVRDFIAQLERSEANTGYLIITGEFTGSAKKLAAQNSGIELFDKHKFNSLLNLTEY